MDVVESVVAATVDQMASQLDAKATPPPEAQETPSQQLDSKIPIQIGKKDGQVVLCINGIGWQMAPAAARQIAGALRKHASDAEGVYGSLGVLGRPKHKKKLARKAAQAALERKAQEDEIAKSESAKSSDSTGGPCSGDDHGH